MRPLRSFLFIFFLFACLAGLYILLPGGARSKGVLSDFLSSASQGPATIKSDTDSIVLLPVEPRSPVVLDILQPFIDSLASSKGQVRVMYYGDSQIEGDRISGKLRELLREGRGGTGPGLFLPVMPVMYTESIWIQSSSNWKRYNYVSYNDGEISDNRFGPFMVKCRYLPEGESTATPVKATVRVRPSGLADSATAYFDKLRILYNCEDGPVSVRVIAGNTVLMADTLSLAPGVRETRADLNGASQFTIEFEGQVSPDIYAISVESGTGVVVDNIPLRGSAGLEFTMVDNPTLNEWMDLLNLI